MADVDDARRELLAEGLNAFAVGGDSTATQVLAFPERPLTRPEVANLVAWLTIVAGLADADVMPILRTQGYVLPDEATRAMNRCLDLPQVERALEFFSVAHSGWAILQHLADAYREAGNDFVARDLAGLADQVERRHREELARR